MKKCFSLIALGGLAVVSGCSNEPQTATPAVASSPIDGSEYLLTTEPENAAEVNEVRAQAKDQDEVVIVGRIGGAANPWVAGRAAFSIVDLSLKSCLECGSTGCPKPWDYC